MVGCVIGRSFFARQILTLECYLVGLGGSVGLDRDVSGDLAAGDGIGAVAVILDRDVLAADLRRGLVIIVQRVRRPEGIVFPAAALRLSEASPSSSFTANCGWTMNWVVLLLIIAEGAFLVGAFAPASIFADEITTFAVPAAFVLNVSFTTAVEADLSPP